MLCCRGSQLALCFSLGDKLVLKTQEYDGHAVEYIGYVAKVRGLGGGASMAGVSLRRGHVLENLRVKQLFK